MKSFLVYAEDGGYCGEFEANTKADAIAAAAAEFGADDIGNATAETTVPQLSDADFAAYDAAQTSQKVRAEWLWLAKKNGLTPDQVKNMISASGREAVSARYKRMFCAEHLEQYGEAFDANGESKWG